MSSTRFKQWRVIRQFLGRYIRDYGGLGSILRSPFLHFAILFAVLVQKQLKDGQLQALTLQTIPNLLGFSLGAYALLFSLISQRLKGALKAIQNDNGVSYFDEMNATFLHFILMQVVAFLWVVGSQSTIISDINNLFVNEFGVILYCDIFMLMKWFSDFIGLVLFIYVLLLVIAASLTVYRLARIMDPEG